MVLAVTARAKRRSHAQCYNRGRQKILDDRRKEGREGGRDERRRETRLELTIATRTRKIEATNVRVRSQGYER